MIHPLRLHRPPWNGVSLRPHCPWLIEPITPAHLSPPTMAPPTTPDVNRPRITTSSILCEAPSPVLVNGSTLCCVRTVGANLSIRVVNIWHQSKVKISHLLGNTPPVARNPHEPTHPLPHEIAEMIIAYLIHDLHALKACSLTCRSWYIIAAPRIHHTLILRKDIPCNELKPLFKLHGLGLIPLVREIRVERWGWVDNWFVPQVFCRRSLRHFSAFANVHTLALQEVDIYRFIPHIERYFGQFSPTLRSIVLSHPCCTPQQLSHFLSLFPNLDDIMIWGLLSPFLPRKTVPDVMPNPFSAPKPRGLLVLGGFDWVETWTHLIASCGGLRFRHMELQRSASCTPALLEACTETLETLRFYATDHPQSRLLRVYVFTDLTDGERELISSHFQNSIYRCLKPSVRYKSGLVQAAYTSDETPRIPPSWRYSRPSHPQFSPSLLLSSRPKRFQI